MALPSLSLAVSPRSLSAKIALAVLLPLLRLLIRPRSSRPLFRRWGLGFSSALALVFLALPFSSGGSGSNVLLAADATWISSRSSGTWTTYQGHELVVVVATYKPRNTNITNSTLIGVTTSNVPIRNASNVYAGGNGFYYQNQTDTTNFYCLYCEDLDLIITYDPPSGMGAQKIKPGIIASDWYKNRRAREPAFESIIDVASLFSTIAQLLINWIVIAVGVAISIFICVRGTKWFRRLVLSIAFKK